MVTGGATGIGKATAIAFAEEGARVVIGDRDLEGETVAKIILDATGEAIFVQADISETLSVQALIDKTINTYKRLDIAFNNAGIGPALAYLADIPEEDFERCIKNNLIGCFLCIKYEIPQMLKQGGGVIVNASSVGGVRTSSGGVSDYNASKFGISGMSATAALEYAHLNIRINAICPGATITEMLQRTFKIHPEYEQSALNGIPMERLASTDDISRVVLFLCSDDASYITGQNIVVDGGKTLMGGGLTSESFHR